jgi:hypothetical protein
VSTADVRVDAVTLPSASPHRGGLTRRVHGLALLCLACTALLAPWVAYLATSLPSTHVTTDWNGAWVGFDVLLMVLLGVTGVLARRQHPLHAPAAYASAAFLVADAWFDVTTSGTNLAVSLVSAAVVELPLAAYLVRHATRVTTEATRAATPPA